jgi:hypothetical protein
MPAQFRDRIVQSDLGEATGDPRAEPRGRLWILADGVTQNLSDLLLGTTTVPTRSTLQPGLYLLV